MKQSADVVVVGAGIIGAAIAYECARHGIGRVVAVDAASGPAEGSTGASSSICRTRYSHPEVIQLAVDGVAAYRGWDRYLGIRTPLARFVTTGALWVADRPSSEISAEVRRLRDAGTRASALEHTEIGSRYPQVSLCVSPWTEGLDHECRGAEAYLFEDGAGYVDPAAALSDLLEAAQRLGAEVRFRSPVTQITKVGGRVTGVVLASGEVIAAGTVINAAGPWVNRLNDLAGVELDWTLTPTRIQTLHHPWPPDDIPIVIDVATGVYVRPDRNSDTIWAGSVREEDEREVVDPDDYLRSPNQTFRDRMLVLLQHRLPALRPSVRVPGIAGLYTINREDVHPVVGPSGIAGFWLANGFSGHGFKLAPAIGSMVARRLGGAELDFDTSVRLDLFAVDREPLGVDAKNVLA